MGDYAASFDNLYRYFDYTMHNRDRIFYQYALLNLAVLHADFGAYSEAIIAMQETISTAREHEDLECLNYSLSWLYHFSKAHPEYQGKVLERGLLGADKEALTFLKAKAKETRIDNLDAAQHILSQLRAVQDLSHDLSYCIALLEIELQIRREDYTNAMQVLGKLAEKLDAGDFDIYKRIKVMICKVRIYDKAGIPQKGFSVALRAATLAYHAQISPVLWEAICAICAIFHSMKEFEGSMRLLEVIIPQVLECEDCDLAAHAFSLLADAHVGKAGLAKGDSLQRKEQLTKGLVNLDIAFDEFSQIEDVKGQCEMLAKKARIMHLNGDPVLANDCVAEYLAIVNAAKEPRL
ncbi:MAG: hypothetical protein Q9217_003978 [Psora testacea]